LPGGGSGVAAHEHIAPPGEEQTLLSCVGIARSAITIALGKAPQAERARGKNSLLPTGGHSIRI
jgi:hypothetical protein